VLTQDPNSSVQLKYIQFNSIQFLQFSSLFLICLKNSQEANYRDSVGNIKKLRPITNHKRNRLKRGNIYKRHRQNCNNNNNNNNNNNTNTTKFCENHN